MSKLVTIIVARKPLSEPTVADNILEWGCGAINIDGSRIATQDSLCGGAYAENPTDRGGNDVWTRYRKADSQCFKRGGAGNYEQPIGRWPANLILEHRPGCTHLGTKRVKPFGGSGRAGSGGHGFQDQYVGGEKQRDGFAGGFVDDDGLEEIEHWECVEDCPARDLGEQSGVRPAGVSNNQAEVGAISNGATPIRRGMLVPRSDFGTAARFFKSVQGDSDEK